MQRQHLSVDATWNPASNLPGRVRGALRRPAFSLVEVLVVLTILGILAGLAIPYLSSTSIDQLQAVAGIVVADIDYARNLAISNGSEYRLTLQPASNRYQLTHSGTNTLLHALPTSPFKSPGDTAAQQTTRLDHLPIGAGHVQLLGAKRATGSTTELTEVTFTSLGGTSIPEATLIWLTAGQGSTRRYLAVRINAATGLAEVDPLTATAPTGLAALSSLP
ncbi:Tfp pilus assembly protein FimT/FimU [Anatilimnocola sp. NA78]|uniref:pilus assembly FimT family protein n=1 Tax=Anatilimnocola sp. NA78 TaxID=3415683 RepID=UPI003CE55A26